MTTCPQCGTENAPGAAFCGGCGNALGAVAEDRTVIRPAADLPPASAPAAATPPPAAPTPAPQGQWGAPAAQQPAPQQWGAPPAGPAASGGSGGGVDLGWLIKGNWLGAASTALAAFAVALVFAALVAFTTMSDFDFVSALWTTFLLTGATFGADIVTKGDDATQWMGQIPVMGTLLALGAAVVVFRRTTAGYAKWTTALVDAVRASLIFSVILLVMGIAVKIGGPEINGYYDEKGGDTESELVSAGEIEYPEREYIEAEVEYPDYPDYPDYPSYTGNSKQYDKAVEEYELEYDRIEQEYDEAVQEYETAQAEAEEKQAEADEEYEEALEEYEDKAEAAEEKAEENQDKVAISASGRTGLELGQTGDDTIDVGEDADDVTVTSSIPGLIFLGFLMMLAVLVLSSFVRRDWLDKNSSKAHDWLAAPLRAFGLLAVALSAVGLVYVAAVMIGQEESRSLAHAVSMIAVLPALGMRLLALGIGGKFGWAFEYDGDDEDYWVHLAGFAEVHGATFWVALVVPWLLAALVALTIAKKSPERPFGALGNLGAFFGLGLILMPLFVRLANAHASVDYDGDEGSGVSGVAGAAPVFLFLLAVVVVGLVVLAVTGKIDLGKVKSAAASMQTRPAQPQQWGAPGAPAAPAAPPAAPGTPPPPAPPAQGWEPPQG